jgi:prepilin-type processing-associated H-X9-DG protein
MTYPFPPPAPWISIGGCLLLVLVGVVALAAAFAPMRPLPQIGSIRIRWRWLLTSAVFVAAAAALASIAIREVLAAFLVFVDAIALTLALTRACLFPLGRKLTVGSGCAGLLVASVLAFIFVFLPAVKLARESATRTTCRSTLKNLGIVMHNYVEGHDGTFPDTVSGASDGAQQSWRINLLPLLDQPDLRSSYSPTVAWDAPANLPVGRTRLHSFICSANNFPTDDSGRYFAAFAALTGPSTVFPTQQGIRLAEVTDGTSHTILIGECSGLTIVWTEPRDINVSKQKIGINLSGDRPRFSSSILSSYHRGGAYAAFADGHVQFLSEKIDPRVLQALTTATGAETIPDDAEW